MASNREVGVRWLLLALAPAFVDAAFARELSFEDRVQAQGAIERVYYAHQIDSTRSFEEAVPRPVLERKVRTYLGQSAALERYWHTPVTSEMLSSELERMVRGTRMPERLAELLGALGGDRLLAEECLARATLVDRLARNFFAFDARIHEAARRQAERLREDLVAGRIDSFEEHPLRTALEIVREVVASADHDVASHSLGLAPEDFERARSAAPATPGEIGAMHEESEAFVIRVVLEEQPGRARLATFVVPKVRWDSWWAGVRDGLERVAVPTVSPGGSLPVVGGMEGASLPCVPDDRWSTTNLAVPEGRYLHTAVWTGSLMIVWGGLSLLDSGGRYDPATDAWSPTTTVNAPSGRSFHTAVWTGSRMIVWGGRSSSFQYLNSGAQYDPVNDSWVPTSTAGAASPRYRHTAVWTGSRMIVWGGQGLVIGLNAGGLYDPVADSWVPTSTPAGLTARVGHSVVWTGTRMIVWGGNDNPTNSGWRYHPQTNSWAQTSLAGAPSSRVWHTAVWTGSRMLVWGGNGNGTGFYGDGGSYDPGADLWTALPSDGAPSPRRRHSAVWTGERMLVWGGEGPSPTNTGGSYWPDRQTWAPTSLAGAPSPRVYHTAVWTGATLVLWGGQSAEFESLHTGARYDPSTDDWMPMASNALPSGRTHHTDSWTGSLMVIWGGKDSSLTRLDTGARYDPATDSWSPTSAILAPTPRGRHTAVWTGNSLIVWGGEVEQQAATNTGSAYDPIGDLWTPVAIDGAPTSRYAHTAVWTGGRMIVWGGTPDDSSSLSTGGRYDPSGDSWTPTAAGDLQVVASHDHTVVWTGSLMIVWGGVTNGNVPAGSRYDPVEDTWAATSQLGAPKPRRGHTAIWTGDRMAIWGGASLALAPFNTGGLYDPVSDSWTPTSLSGAPQARYSHTAVWTGDEMVVWGGFTDLDPFSTSPAAVSASGGRYDRATDSWATTFMTGSPPGRYLHTAVWTGSQMIVWGGRPSQDPDAASFANGGSYVLGSGVDDDDDGFTECDGDCNDGQSGVHPGAIEVCDGLDNDCSGTLYVDEADADGDGYLFCSGDCAPEDGGAWAVPPEIAGLMLGPEPFRLTWEPASRIAGSGIEYEIARGVIAELPVGNGSFETCILAVQEGEAFDSEDPTPGNGFWYLVRGGNTCGVGPYGAEGQATDACGVN